ncbi:MAG: dihydrofolate synthase / folylpolyglutamate synthase [Actinomycetota bacterium]|jgi:dihydrofolate synthase/folylpolyglutamate synthase
MNFEEAVAFLDEHINMEKMLAGERATAPTLERIRELLRLLGDPEQQYPIVHVTGTNGKTSTARAIGRLLMAHDLSVGTYTSPHVVSLTERILRDDEPIAPDEFALLIAQLARLEPLLTERATWFELITAAAYAHFADIAVNAAVIEVGLGGTWDATNAANGAVAVVTSVGLDHMEFLGDTPEDVAAEKSGIIKEGADVVVGYLDDGPREVIDIAARVNGAASVVHAGDEFAVTSDRVAIGGRLLSVRTSRARYDEIFMPLHGAHQSENLACAIAATEAFFDRPLNEELVIAAAAGLTAPGRLEVIGRNPLVILDGTKNEMGAAAVKAALDEEWSTVSPRVLVVGLLKGKGKDPKALLDALGARSAKLVIAVPAPSPRAMDADEIAAAARELGVHAETASSVDEGLARAKFEAGADGLVLVAGSLYVAGAASH